MNEPSANFDTFFLDRHGVVEASAGTGKTHTIEHLVLRLLKEESVSLEQILLVTFTEKATGDLKVRLRATLERALQNDDEYGSVLKSAVDHFDQAPIFTIHGFCQRLLQEYALEQGQDFRAELVDDNELLQASLREIQRKDWRAHFGRRLRQVLECAGYNRDSAEAWDRNVLAIAKSYKPRCGHQLRPVFVPDWWRRLDEPDANAAGMLEIFTVQKLHQHLRDFKRQRGLQSFDDMIATVEESLDPEKNADAESFLRVLRERYRFGIVDEFQDTDPLQWRIFRRIFLEGGDSKLFVVGDPKQAIFGFRGADLPTYLKAADEMKTRFDAAEYPLTENWRSDADLLEGLNCLFQDGEWFPRETGIRYLPVHAPDADKSQTRIDMDRSNRAALSIVDFTQNDRPKMAQKQFARFVAHEIQALLGSADDPVITFAHKSSPPRPLHLGDFCILVMKRTDADPIMQSLDLAGIPYSFYKQTGLWQSDEAIHLEVMLQSLARPDDLSSFRKALLTCFFRIKPAELALAPDVPMQHPARRLYQNWLVWAENRQWSALFRSLLDDTGLLLQAVRDVEAERRVAVFRQLLSALENVGHGANLDLLGLLDWVRQRRKQRDGHETEIHPMETSRPKVKIMTIHASKGLEFPIVFLAGGFTQNLVGNAMVSYRDDQQRIVFDLRPDSEALGRVNAERLSEHRRLLYVALTRPIFKLYLPRIKRPNRASQFLGPLGTVLMPALELACPDKLGPLVAETVVPTLFVITPTPDARMERLESIVPSEPIQIEGPLFPVLDPLLGKRRIVIRSFSSMTRHHLLQVGEGSSFGDHVVRTEEEVATPVERDDPLRGPVFGDMVHNVLEHMDFAEVARAASSDDLLRREMSVRRRIDREIKTSISKLRTRAPREQLEEMCRQQIALLIWQTLRTPLSEVGSPLCAIPASDRRTEIEFHFPERPGESVPANVRWEEGFFTGFMDLLFRRNGKYFLVDWKTNLLPAYSPEAIERSMTESDYHRQYRLYLQAISRWLQRVHGPGFHFLQQFGGVYYLYVRGMNGRDETTGVFYRRPTEQDLDLTAVWK